jgi:hypothetical protein
MTAADVAMNKKHHWAVRGSLPAHNEHETKYPHMRENINCHVVAFSAESAAAIVRRHYPTIEIWSVTHSGVIHFMEWS